MADAAGSDNQGAQRRQEAYEKETKQLFESKAEAEQSEPPASHP